MKDAALEASKTVDFSQFSPVELEAFRRTISCWEQHWDEESQTLFGVSRPEMRDALAGWPHGLMRDDEAAILALNNTLNRMLNGARTLSPDRVPEITGLAHEMRALFHRFHRGTMR